MVHFVGAGPGAVDLITLRGKELLEAADVVIYAGSLVNKDLLSFARADAAIYDSAKLTLEEVLALCTEAEEAGKTVVRLHTGDPSLYGTMREQMAGLKSRGIAYDVTPGVSSFCGAAAALQVEYTLPDVSQSLILTRLSGRTNVPERECLRELARHKSSLVLFLSAGLLTEAKEELLSGGYGPETPAAIVYKATWEDERIVRCTVGTLPSAAEEAGIQKTALILVGDFLTADGTRSRLYDPSFTTSFREGQ